MFTILINYLETVNPLPISQDVWISEIIQLCDIHNNEIHKHAIFMIASLTGKMQVSSVCLLLNSSNFLL